MCWKTSTKIFTVPPSAIYVRCSSASGKADSDDDERMVIEQRYKVQVLLLGGK